MSVGIRLLAEDATTALALASELDALNRERRDVEATMHEEALATLDLEEFEGRMPVRCACFATAGTRGSSASSPRASDWFNRPAIVFARGSSGELKGSGRSIAVFICATRWMSCPSANPD